MWMLHGVSCGVSMATGGRNVSDGRCLLVRRPYFNYVELKIPMPVPWKAAYDLGIPSIDAQHRQLITIINEFSERVAIGVSHADTDEMLVQVERHALEHFTYEEGYFTDYGYPEAPSHHQEHQAFLKKIEEFRERVKKEDPLFFVEVLDYLEQWFLHHVQVVDRRYVELFVSRGVR